AGQNPFAETGWPDPEEPEFPEQELRSFCATHFARRTEYLGLLASQPSPCFLFDQARLRENARRFQESCALFFPENMIYYAVKSNNHPALATTLLEESLGLDVSSGVELGLALELGAREIIFSGPGKTDQELDLALAHADRTTILLDSFGELERLEKRAAVVATSVRCGIRLTASGHHRWRKFGIPTARLPEFWGRVKCSPYLDLQGLHFHSSWNLTPERQLAFISELGRTLSTMPKEFCRQLRFIDLGGGYWPEEGEWLQYYGTRIGGLARAAGRDNPMPLKHFRLPALPLVEQLRDLARAVAEHLTPRLKSPRFCFEPGRWLCNDTMHLLLQVIDRKEIDLAITDAGTNSIGWERFVWDYFPILNLSRPALRERPCEIMGSLCTPDDLWGNSYWGEDLKAGDYLLIPNQGAYTYSLRQQFIKTAAPVVNLACALI
ncbi:MAG: alanine racemase, partial [Deltaproteobacteria bacterium]|nr:alanine racemase [Deltaproteobacteria bacterium]